MGTPEAPVVPGAALLARPRDPTGNQVGRTQGVDLDYLFLPSILAQPRTPPLPSRSRLCRSSFGARDI